MPLSLQRADTRTEYTDMHGLFKDTVGVLQIANYATANEANYIFNVHFYSNSTDFSVEEEFTFDIRLGTKLE